VSAFYSSLAEKWSLNQKYVQILLNEDDSAKNNTKHPHPVI
jgi:hypothetical protein